MADSLSKTARRFFQEAGSVGGKIGGPSRIARMTPEQLTAHAHKMNAAKQAKREKARALARASLNPQSQQEDETTSECD